MQVIGIDIGGTEIKAAVVNKEGQLIDKLIIPTPINDGSTKIINAIISIIKRYQMKYIDIKRVGIGSAGRINHTTGLVMYATNNLPNWTGVNIKKEIEKKCAITAMVDNDVNTAAIGERWLGAAKDLEQFVLLTIGTGIGGAFIYKGEVVYGQTGSVSELGHMIIYANGKKCNCGQRGCLEQYVSGHALNKKVKKFNSSWDSYTLLEQYELKNPVAVRIMDSFLSDLAVGLINIQNLFDPELIVIGGGFANTFTLWQSSIENIIKNTTEQKVFLTSAHLGNNAGIVGAAKMALDL